MAASNSRFEQLCGQFVTNIAAFLGYTVIAPQSDTEEGWILTGLAGQPDLRVFKRERHRMRNESPPTIVLVAKGGDIGEPDIVGNQRGGKSGATSESSGQDARCIRVRKFRIQVNCWGATQEQVEDLEHNAINAFEKLGHNAVAFSEELWDNQQTDQDANLAFGELISFFVTVQIQVTNAPQLLGAGIAHIAHVRNSVTLNDTTEVQTL